MSTWMKRRTKICCLDRVRSLRRQWRNTIAAKRSMLGVNGSTTKTTSLGMMRLLMSSSGRKLGVKDLGKQVRLVPFVCFTFVLVSRRHRITNSILRYFHYCSTPNHATRSYADQHSYPTSQVFLSTCPRPQWTLRLELSTCISCRKGHLWSRTHRHAAP